MTISHTEPFSRGLQVVLAAGGWVLFVTQIITQHVTRPTAWRRHALAGQRSRRTGWGRLRRRWDLALTGALFALLIGTAAAVGATGNLSDDCTSAPTCFKVDNWLVADGGYYRQYPYDAQGNSNSSAPWVRISRDEYVAEVGSLLREAALFGLGSLALGMLLNINAERIAPDERQRDDELTITAPGQRSTW
jgi:hypothetical protein